MWLTLRLRQAVDHPLLVMNKIASDEEGAAGDDLLGSKVNGETSLKDMIAMFSGGADESQGEVDPAYAIQVLKELGEAEEVPECMMCHSEIFDEVLLPCYHRG
jgi:DNA repair protein RAD5